MKTKPRYIVFYVSGSCMRERLLRSYRVATAFSLSVRGSVVPIYL